MATIFDVAKYILEKKGPMSTWKLQKLCYYSQAWSIAWTEEPIFEEDFEAWSNGPVCPELYNAHRGLFRIGAEGLKRGVPSALTDDQRESVDVILRDYGDMEPYDLRELSHKEAPWLDARGGLPDAVRCQNVITKDAMGEYYGSL